MITVNNEHKVDVFRRNNPIKIKTLDIDYMRCSLVTESHIYIGTEEKMLFIVDVVNFNIVSSIMT